MVGTHVGAIKRGPLHGTIDGDTVSFQSVLPIEGSKLGYFFSGRVRGDRMEGRLDLGEYPAATWAAVRRGHSGSMPTDPAVSGKIA